MAGACTNRGSDITEPEPVFVEEADGDRLVPAGQFCSCACLARHIEEVGLETGACCQIDPG